MSTVVTALLGIGVAVVAVSAIGAAVMRDTYLRLHFLAPVTSLGGPLIGLAVAFDAGWGLSGFLSILITLLLAVTGPVVLAATGRAVVLHDESLSEESGR
jgi:multisubunit Na+/H+ antiporter MnhG subunit